VQASNYYKTVKSRDTVIAIVRGSAASFFVGAHIGWSGSSAALAHRLAGPGNARDGVTPDPNTKTALQLEAVEPRTTAIVAIFLV
jgi:hypothetical protein